MTKYKSTDSDFTLIVSTSFSIREVLIRLGHTPKGGNYLTIKNRIKKLSLDISHFTGQLWSKGKIIGPKRPIEDYLSNNHFITSHKLRQRLIQEKIFDFKCSSCLLSEWLEGAIPLELDHINGDHSDNTLSNLRLLCPNCHALTSTYRGKNKNKMVPEVGFEPTLYRF